MAEDTPAPALSPFPRQSDAQHLLLPALFAAKAKFRPVTKRNIAIVQEAEGQRSYNYADLAAYIDAVSEALLEQDILIEQEPRTTPGGRHFMCTTLLHVSGQWKASYLPMYSVTDANPHVAGSRLTYARRHGLALMLGLSVRDDDDDGATASALAREEQPQRARRQAAQQQKAAEEAPAASPPALREPQGINEQIARIKEDLKAAFAAGGRDAADIAWQKHARFILAQSDDLQEIIKDGYHAVVNDDPPVPEALDAS
ncbi:hypothetical protein EOD42_14420 [Rhodovarius crocodyli]|uniref:ERF family protein n=1 Tax=Rhodovarius crocodyli TaxID=1979269 RepID=A0A437MF99_9PROT|nr:ERF family protein [Rhodovarius crocodyli]RVT96302.1 hypothetical protein EOD42_14420 [Rhodovarius crocodyli]